MGKSQPQRATKYNEFYGGVRCYTYISQRAERAHIQGTPQAAGSREARLTGRKLQQLVHIYPGYEPWVARS